MLEQNHLSHGAGAVHFNFHPLDPFFHYHWILISYVYEKLCGPGNVMSIYKILKKTEAKSGKLNVVTKQRPA